MMKTFSETKDMENLNMSQEKKRIVHCPQCHFTFDISYGRTFACSGCPSSVQCNMAKCPKCGHEFPLPS